MTVRPASREGGRQTWEGTVHPGKLQRQPGTTMFRIRKHGDLEEWLGRGLPTNQARKRFLPAPPQAETLPPLPPPSGSKRREPHARGRTEAEAPGSPLRDPGRQPGQADSEEEAGVCESPDSRVPSRPFGQGQGHWQRVLPSPEAATA